METPQLLESSHLIRFPDCDPFNHLNNARYLDYFINAREDQVWDAYGINITTWQKPRVKAGWWAPIKLPT